MENQDSLTPTQYGKMVGMFPDPPHNPLPTGGYMDAGFDWVVHQAESKSMFGKDKNGKMYARRRNGEIITHNAESFCADCKSAEGCGCGGKRAEMQQISDDEELFVVRNDRGQTKGFVEMEDDLEDESIEIEISDDEMNEIAEITLDAEFSAQGKQFPLTYKPVEYYLEEKDGVFVIKSKESGTQIELSHKYKKFQAENVVSRLNQIINNETGSYLQFITNGEKPRMPEYYLQEKESLMIYFIDEPFLTNKKLAGMPIIELSDAYKRENGRIFAQGVVNDLNRDLKNTINGLLQFITNKVGSGYMKDIGLNRAETFGAFSINEDDEGKIHIENKCDGCGKEFLFTQNSNIVGGNRAGAIVYENLEGATGHDYPEYSPYGDLLCKSCWKINREEDEDADSRGQGQYGAETKKCPKCKEENLGIEEMYYCYDCGDDNADPNGCSCGSSNIGLEEMDYCYNCGSQGHWFDAETATYEPSQEADMEAPATEPTNANFDTEFIKPSRDWFSLALGTAAVVIGGSLFLQNRSMFKADGDGTETSPSLVAHPSTGDLLPADYEEMIVESTGYAVPIIPVSLDPAFMGSRFHALPTDRTVESNEPGIGAHTDVAMTRDTDFREPEQSMITRFNADGENCECSLLERIKSFFTGKSCCEGKEVKEANSVTGQTPYFGVGFDGKNTQTRVIKETNPISLDPSTAPYIPQNLSGYTGQAYTPPTVYSDMMNIGVSGQNPAFVSTQSSSLQSVHGNLSAGMNQNYTDGSRTMSLSQWSIDYDVSQTSDSEAFAVSRSSGVRTMIRRV